MNQFFVILVITFACIISFNFSQASEEESDRASSGCEEDLLNLLLPGFMEQAGSLDDLNAELALTKDPTRRKQLKEEIHAMESRTLVATLIIAFSNEEILKLYKEKPYLFEGFEHYFMDAIEQLKDQSTNPYILEKIEQQEQLAEGLRRMMEEMGHEEDQTAEVSEQMSNSSLLGLVALNLMVRQNLEEITLSDEEVEFFGLAQNKYAERMRSIALERIRSMDLNESIHGEEAFQVLAGVFDLYKVDLEEDHELFGMMPSKNSLQIIYSKSVPEEELEDAFENGASLADVNELMQTKSVLLNRATNKHEKESITIIKDSNGFEFHMKLDNQEHQTTYKHHIRAILDPTIENDFIELIVEQSFQSDRHKEKIIFSGRVLNP